MNPKKADISIAVIIAAVIGLVALVVVIAIFTNTTQKTSENIGSCAAKGGKCAGDMANQECSGTNPIPLFVSGGCEDKTPKNLCCLKATN